jgi:hypothetical protein
VVDSGALCRPYGGRARSFVGAYASDTHVYKLVGVDPHAYLLRALYAAIAQPGAITFPEDLLNAQPA